MIMILIYLLTAIGLSPGGSSTVHIYTQTIHRTTQNKQYIERHKTLEECGPCPVLASYTLAFALQLRKKHGKTSVRVFQWLVKRFRFYDSVRHCLSPDPLIITSGHNFTGWILCSVKITAKPVYVVGKWMTLYSETPGFYYHLMLLVTFSFLSENLGIVL